MLMLMLMPRTDASGYVDVNNDGNVTVNANVNTDASVKTDPNT
jgi:hypothetical protein